MEHRVRRAAGDVDHYHCVFKCLPGEDVRRSNVLRQEVLDRASCGQAFQLFCFGLGGVRGGPRERHAHDFDRGGHGVGSVHATACTAARTCVSDDVETLVFADLACNELTVCLECRNDVDISIVLGGGTARFDRATIDHQRRSVYSSHGHDDTRHVLITPRDRYIGIVPLASHDRLDRIGDEISALQAVTHPLRTH